MSQPEIIQAKLRREIGELSDSINGLVDAFRKLRTPLVESQQKVPQATDQLDTINKQTEAATHRMLDVVEVMTQREQEVIGGLSAIGALTREGRADEANLMVRELETKVSANLNDAYSLMDALQFQDITSQQMNHAAAILEEIEGKLQNILTVVGVDTVPQMGSATKERKVRAYDPHADLSDKQTQQAEIDSLFEAQKQK